MGQLLAVFSFVPSLRSWKKKREETRIGKDTGTLGMLMLHAAVLLVPPRPGRARASDSGTAYFLACRLTLNML